MENRRGDTQKEKGVHYQKTSAKFCCKIKPILNPFIYSDTPAVATPLAIVNTMTYYRLLVKRDLYFPAILVYQYIAVFRH